MINFLKKYIAKNYLDIQAESDQLSIIKTQNGLGQWDRKIVFYVMKKNLNHPSLVVYSARSQSANEVLINSISSLELNQQFGPKLLFKDYYQDIIFWGVEFLNGRKLNLENKVDMNLSWEYLMQTFSQTDLLQKTLEDFYQELKKKFLQLGLNINSFLSPLPDNVGSLSLPIIPQHGDFQDNNLFIVDKRLKIIDWDDYGQINFPLFDFLTLALKYQRKIGKDKYIDEQFKKFYELAGVSGIDQKIILKLYYLYDFLRKDRLRFPVEKKQYLEILINKLKEIN